MRRRALLASGSALLGSALAGCVGESGDGDGTTDAATTTSTETTAATTQTVQTTQFDVTLDVAMERHQPGVAVMGIDSVGVSSAGKQYLFYRVTVTDGDPPARTDFGFRYGGQVYAPGVETAGMLWRAQETDDRYTADRGAGWLVFELPAQRPARHAAFALGSEEWPVSDAVRKRLSAPEPPLSVDWGLTDEQPADAVRLAFTVTNEGDLDTRFVAGLNGILIEAAHAPVTAFNREVPAGETVSWTHTHEGAGPYVASTEEASDKHYHLEWTQGEGDLYVARAE
ncbi:MAG: hypothetical protein ABEH83_07390 [Halobacterium sp.]